MSKPLESLLRQAGLVSEPALHRSLEQSRKRNLPLADVLISEGHLSEEALADSLARLMKLPRIRLASTTADPEAIKRLPDKIARKHACIPVGFEGRMLVVAMVNPADYLAIQDIEFAAAMSIKPVVATRTEILDSIEERYDPEDRIGEFLANVPDVSDIKIVQEDAQQQDLGLEVADSKSAADAPVVKMVNLVVYDALKAGSSDLHIEPTLHDVQVRMRVDGVLRDYTRVPKWLHGPMVSRLKILAKLDIAERRLPQDGRINVQYQGRTIDIRVSTLPTHFGEKVVLRILGGSSLPQIEKLGFDEPQTVSIEASIGQPQGIILITGPTGSGKTTTLYAMLARRRSPEVNIVTVEDPIEYQLPGINQVQINSKAGLSFAAVLRSILRQDPDVILVGELRDQETAEVAFQAAMTGHLVLTTLHTNSAPAAIPRLFDLEVDPSILSTSLTLVIAQRLVRRVCEGCRESYVPDATTAARVGLMPGESAFRGRGCSACGTTGYAGRIGIYEFFRPTTVVRRLIHERAGEADLRSAARQGGMKILREDALAKIRAGITSPDEVIRVVQIDETEVPCPNCKAPIETDFSTCPYCLHTIKVTCTGCGQELKPGWRACPYCHTKVEAGEPAPGAPAHAAGNPAAGPPAAAARPAEAPAKVATSEKVAQPGQAEPPMVTITGKVVGELPAGTEDEKFTKPGAGFYPGTINIVEFPETDGSARGQDASAPGEHDGEKRPSAPRPLEPEPPAAAATPEAPRHPRRRPPADELVVAGNSGAILNPDAVERAEKRKQAGPQRASQGPGAGDRGSVVEVPSPPSLPSAVIPADAGVQAPTPGPAVPPPAPATRPSAVIPADAGVQAPTPGPAVPPPAPATRPSAVIPADAGVQAPTPGPAVPPPAPATRPSAVIPADAGIQDPTPGPAVPPPAPAVRPAAVIPADAGVQAPTPGPAVPPPAPAARPSAVIPADAGIQGPTPGPARPDDNHSGSDSPVASGNGDLQAAAPEDVPAARKLRILVVDDDEDIRQVVSFTLRKLPVAVEIATAFDGQDAVEQAEDQPPDLVVLDVMMPRMDGFETCQRLRQNVRTAFVPVLMLTASADEASRTKGYLVGTDDYMSKPFMPPDLSLRVSRLLRRTYGI